MSMTKSLTSLKLRGMVRFMTPNHGQVQGGRDASESSHLCEPKQVGGETDVVPVGIEALYYGPRVSSSHPFFSEIDDGTLYPVSAGVGDEEQFRPVREIRAAPTDDAQLSRVEEDKAASGEPAGHADEELDEERVIEGIRQAREDMQALSRARG